MWQLVTCTILNLLSCVSAKIHTTSSCHHSRCWLMGGGELIFFAIVSVCLRWGVFRTFNACKFCLPFSLREYTEGCVWLTSQVFNVYFFKSLLSGTGFGCVFKWESLSEFSLLLSGGKKTWQANLNRQCRRCMSEGNTTTPFVGVFSSIYQVTFRLEINFN